MNYDSKRFAISVMIAAAAAIVAIMLFTSCEKLEPAKPAPNFGNLYVECGKFAYVCDVKNFDVSVKKQTWDTAQAPKSIYLDSLPAGYYKVYAWHTYKGRQYQNAKLVKVLNGSNKVDMSFNPQW